MVDVRGRDANGGGGTGRMEGSIQPEYVLAVAEIRVNQFDRQRHCLFDAVKVQEQFEQLRRVPLFINDEETVGQLYGSVTENPTEDDA